MVKRECTDLGRTSVSGSNKIWLHFFLIITNIFKTSQLSLLFVHTSGRTKKAPMRPPLAFVRVSNYKNPLQYGNFQPSHTPEPPKKSSLPSFLFQTIFSQFLKSCPALFTESHYIITYTNLFLLFWCVCDIISVDIWTYLGMRVPSCSYSVATASVKKGNILGHSREQSSNEQHSQRPCSHTDSCLHLAHHILSTNRAGKQASLHRRCRSN